MKPNSCWWEVLEHAAWSIKQNGDMRLLKIGLCPLREMAVTEMKISPISAKKTIKLSALCLIRYNFTPLYLLLPTMWGGFLWNKTSTFCPTWVMINWKQGWGDKLFLLSAVHTAFKLLGSELKGKSKLHYLWSRCGNLCLCIFNP